MRHEEHHRMGGRGGRHERGGHGKHGKPLDRPKSSGAQTFRRGRALHFLQILNVKRDTLLQQLTQPELQTIHQVLSGELKAIDMVMNEFIVFFELYEARDSEEGQESPQEASAEQDEGDPSDEEAGNQ